MSRPTSVKDAPDVGRAEELDARSIRPLPERLAVGSGTALFVDGRCSHHGAGIAGLDVVVDGAVHPALGVGMPPPGPPPGDDYWWSIVQFDPVTQPRVVELRLRARLHRGGEAEAPIGRIELRPQVDVNGAGDPRPAHGAIGQAVRPGAEAPLIAICMATHEPPLDLFEWQIASIRAQTHPNWVCLISDDCSRPERVEAMRAVLGDDERFSLSRAGERLGVYRNFERALSLAPRDAAYVSLSDQDDVWYPHKLERLRCSMREGSRLAYSDMRIVHRDGRVISDTYWSHRRNNHANFASLLIANTITGAASLMSREVLEYALPFPPARGETYHDHWLALVAMALGEITYVDEPLYDYVQHEAAALGHARANRAHRGGATRSPVLLDQLRRRRFARRGRALYFDLYCRIAIMARVVEMRCGTSMERDKRRTVTRFGDSVRGMAWLAVRSARPLLGGTETLSREQALLGALAWRRLAELRSRLGTLRRLRGPRTADSPAVGESPPEAAAGKFERPPRSPEGEPAAWLVPLLVDYFTRDGSTLMMRLLASSPQVAVEQIYPYERKYFSYLWRWSQMLERGDWPEETWGPPALGSIAQERPALLGPPPWRRRSLIESGSGEESMGRRCFELAWAEFSRRAMRWTRAEGGGSARPVRYYAEKHLDTWRLDANELPPFKTIALLRDPRDSYASIVAFDRRSGDSDFGADDVTSSDYVAHMIDRQRPRLRWIADLLDGGRVPVIRYETLVHDIHAVARRLEDWLNVELDPDAVAGDRRLRDLHVTASSPEQSIGRWRRELDPETASVFSRELGPELRAVGLDP